MSGSPEDRKKHPNVSSVFLTFGLADFRTHNQNVEFKTYN